MSSDSFRRYGVCYKGSKNGIAEWVVNNLPDADTFVDLFCGGCAITHRALLTERYKHFIINDIDGRMPQFFIDSVHGKYTLENHPEWVSREEFFRRKDEDIYVALVWSFGNDGETYIYGRELEPLKKALHYAVFYGDLSLFNELGVQVPDLTESGGW